MQDKSLFSILGKHALFNGLTAEQISQIIPLLKEHHYQAGQIIIAEGEMTSELYFLAEGKVRLNKKDADGRQIDMGQLSPYSAFGDISFLDVTSSRALSVTAIEEVTVLSLARKDLEKIGSQYLAIINVLTANIAKINIERLNKSNQSYIKTLKQAIEELQLRKEFGTFFAYVVGIVSLSNFIFALTKTHAVTTTLAFSWAYLIVALIPILFLIVFYHYKIQDFGVNLKNLWAVVLEGVLFGVILSILLIVGIITYHHLLHQPQRFYKIPILETLLYIPHSYLQEFIIRGVVQTLLERFLNDKRGIKSVLISALLFSNIHFFIGLLLTIITFWYSLLIGFIYRRHRNLIGITIIHAITGTAADYLGLL